ncbi:hypothetical protein LJC61_06050 [Ruminococcaceae bacterium OttesenSCG-928-A16]|nr:hypothetical protein [Ruminococcaceae bacterium OttesenSCG-928-A16]
MQTKNGTRKSKKWQLRILCLAILLVLVTGLGFSALAQGDSAGPQASTSTQMVEENAGSLPEGEQGSPAAQPEGSEQAATPPVEENTTSLPQSEGEGDTTALQPEGDEQPLLAEAQMLQKAPRMAGDVVLTKFTVAPTATAAENSSTAAYNTAQDVNNVLTVRGVYKIDGTETVTDALVEITLTNKDLEGYLAQKKAISILPPAKKTWAGPRAVATEP